MNSSTDYIAALDEIRVLVKQRPAPVIASTQRLKALAAAVAEYAAAHGPEGAALPSNPGRNRWCPEGVKIVSISRDRGDFVSILRLRHRILLARRGVPVVVITPLGGSSSEVAK